MEDSTMSANKPRARAKKPELVSRVRPDTLEAQPDELGVDPGQVGPHSAGQSGDAQGLPRRAQSSAQSIEDLAATDQSAEAGIVDGVEDAANHPEKHVHAHGD